MKPLGKGAGATRLEVNMYLHTYKTQEGVRLSDEVECAFCGSVLQLRKAVKMEPKTGEFKYACPNCAVKWKNRK